MLITLICGACALALVAMVPAAFGGPSLPSLLSKALRRAGQADARSHEALKSAERALKTARLAQHTASGGPRMHYVSQSVSVAPLAFAQATLKCPAGFLVAGSAMDNGAIVDIGQADAASAVMFDGYNPSTTKTFSYTAQANCIKSSGFNDTTVPSNSAARRQLATADQQFRRALRATASRGAR